MKKLIEKRLNYDEDLIAIFLHGINIIFYDGLGFLSVLILAFLFNKLLIGILYIIIFSSLRIHAGGFHASTKLGCFALYNLLFISFILTLNSPLLNPIINIPLTMIATLIIFKYAPVEHIYAPLTIIEKYRNKDKIRFSLLFLLILYIISLGIDLEYYKVISITLIYASMLMILHMNSKYYKG